MRRSNLAAVVKFIDRNPHSSQSDIAVGLALTSGGVSSLVAELTEREVLSSTSGASTRSAGRPRQILSLSAPGRVVVGVDVNVDEIAVSIASVAGERLARSAVPLGRAPEDARELADRISLQVRDMFAAEPLKPTSLVIAIPGSVRDDSFMAPSFGWGWDFRPTSELLTPFLDDFAVASLVNDGDAAAYCEAQAAHRQDVVVAVHGSDGIGGGIVVDGVVLEGHRGVAGEIGHVVSDPAGLVCSACGQRGCLVSVLSVSALARSLGMNDPGTGYRELAKEIAARAEGGDEPALEVLAIARRNLLRVVRTLAAVVSPEAVVLTGNLQLLAPWLASDVPTDLPGEFWHRAVTASTFGVDSVIEGATELARQQFLEDAVAMMRWSSGSDRGVADAGVRPIEDEAAQLVQ